MMEIESSERQQKDKGWYTFTREQCSRLSQVLAQVADVLPSEQDKQDALKLSRVFAEARPSSGWDYSEVVILQFNSESDRDLINFALGVM